MRIRHDIKGSVSVVFTKEGDTFIAHCPVLDLSSCGKTFDEARSAFNEALVIFFEECTERKTLEKVLSPLGWEFKGKSPNRRISPPLFVGQSQVDLEDLCPA